MTGAPQALGGAGAEFGAEFGVGVQLAGGLAAPPGLLPGVPHQQAAVGDVRLDAVEFRQGADGGKGFDVAGKEVVEEVTAHPHLDLLHLPHPDALDGDADGDLLQGHVVVGVQGAHRLPHHKVAVGAAVEHRHRHHPADDLVPVVQGVVPGDGLAEHVQRLWHPLGELPGQHRRLAPGGQYLLQGEGVAGTVLPGQQPPVTVQDEDGVVHAPHRDAGDLLQAAGLEGGHGQLPLDGHGLGEPVLPGLVDLFADDLADGGEGVAVGQFQQREAQPLRLLDHAGGHRRKIAVGFDGHTGAANLRHPVDETALQLLVLPEDVAGGEEQFPGDEPVKGVRVVHDVGTGDLVFHPAGPGQQPDALDIWQFEKVRYGKHFFPFSFRDRMVRQVRPLPRREQAHKGRTAPPRDGEQGGGERESSVFWSTASIIGEGPEVVIGTSHNFPRSGL